MSTVEPSIGDEPGYYAYLLHCADNTLYAGWTTDPAKRLNAHNDGTGAKYTRSRRPVQFARLWRFESRQEAMRYEARLKRMSRPAKERLISSDPTRHSG